VLLFAALYLRDRRQASKNPTGAIATQIVRSIHDTMLPWLAEGLKRYLTEVYMLSQSCEKPPPPPNLARPDAQRQYVQLDPDKV